MHEQNVDDGHENDCYCRDGRAKVTAEIVTIGEDGEEIVTIEVSYVQVPGWEPDAYSLNPDALGCPKHRPIKQYCRIHHVGFYGDCPPCQSRALIDLSEPRPAVDLDGSPAVSTEAPGEDEKSKLEAQKQVIESAIEDLS